MKFLQNLPRTVLLVGLASLFTDIAGEGIYSILPLFLTTVLGAGPLALGIIEGVAESTASMLKVFSGIWTDLTKKRKPLILWGYGLTGFCRPLIALASVWPVVLLLRFIDRMGKGIRSSPRDALIADVTSPSNRGASYGFHSAMDDAGQLAGPFLTALLLLPFFGLSLRNVIFLSVIPGAIAWLILWGIKEKKSSSSPQQKHFHPGKDWEKLGGNFKRLLAILLLFTLGNSTDAFLLIRLSQVGVSAAQVAMLWGLNGGVRMIASLFGGALSDRFGRKPLMIGGWMYYALIYLAFALVSQPAGVVAVFLAYGVFYGLTEPSEKAFVADLVPDALRGTAFGYYNLVIGLGALPASLLFGFVGQRWGYPVAFMVGAAFAGLASLLLLSIRKNHGGPSRRRK
jgi:MFS family permease